MTTKARRTHCGKGHEYTVANTRITPQGRQDCRTCAREKANRLYRQKKERGEWVSKGRGLRTIVKWTEEEDATLVELAPNFTSEEIAQKMDRGLNSINNRIRKFQAEGRIGRKVTWKAPRTTWEPGDIAALVELRRTCTDQQIAEYMGRPRTAVSAQLQRLRESGQIAKGVRNGMWTIPWAIPAKAILLAKTCIVCGKLRGADLFDSTGGRQWGDGRCRVCQKVRRKRRYHEIEKWAEQNVELLQQATVPLANNVGEPYTSEEYEQISDATRSTFELAISLGRTYYGIDGQRKRLGMCEKRPHRPLADTHWTIKFPNAMKALQEHFRTIGQPVPEELWEWNDEEVSA